MKIGFLVEGQAEYYSLPKLFPRLRSRHKLLNPLLCPMQPLSTPGQIAYVASKKFPLLLERKVDRIVILIDKETRQECTGELASAIANAASERLGKLSSRVALSVVIKVARYENWLVADPASLQALPGLFAEVGAVANKVTGQRADLVDGLALLKKCAVTGGYDKTRGAVAICKKLDPDRASDNSKSFAKFLRVLEPG
jgi:hypothetical protein